MVKQTLIILYLVNLCLFTSAQSAIDITATNAYEAGDYTNAIRLFSQLIDSGYHHAELYINLGHAYYQTENLGMALVNYLRAQQIHPRDDELNQLISQIRLQLGENITSPDHLVYQLGAWSKTWLTIGELQILTFLLWTAFFSGLSIFVLIRVTRPWLLIILPPIGIILIIFLSSYLSRSYIEYIQPLGVIVQNTVALKSGPADTFLTFSDLPSATELHLLEEKDKWVHVMLLDGQEGWLPRDAIILVNEK